MSKNKEHLQPNFDIQLDFNKASYKWMLNKFKTSSKTYKYYCKYPKCIGSRMLYPKHNINYKLNIYSDYCTKHNNKYSNNITKFKTMKTKNFKIIDKIIDEIIDKPITNLLNTNHLDEINLDEL